MEKAVPEKYVSQLEEKVEFYEKVLNRIPAILYVMDLKANTIQWASPGFGNVLNYSYNDVSELGKNILNEVTHPDDIGIFESSMNFYDESDGPIHGICRIKDTNGSYKWVYGNSVVFQRDENANAIQSMGLVIDVNKKMFTENQLQELVKENHRLKNMVKLKCLTKREKEIIKLFAKGQTCSKIAEMLSLSVHTVDTHRRNLIRKLRLHNTKELAAFAINNGLY